MANHPPPPEGQQPNRLEVVDELSVQERSCLLRAARERIRQLNEMAESYHAGHDTKQLELVVSEVNCLNAAVAWIWRQHLKL